MSEGKKPRVRRSREERDAELRRKMEHWLANGGVEEIQAANERARRTSEAFAESTRVDWRTLHEPMDF